MAYAFSHFQQQVRETEIGPLFAYAKFSKKKTYASKSIKYKLLISIDIGFTNHIFLDIKSSAGNLIFQI